jgi:hypothetical protein
MKRLLLTKTILISFISFSFAQTDSGQVKTKEFKWEISASINSVEAQIGDPLITSWDWAYQNLVVLGNRTDKSFSFSIIPKYSIGDNVKLRCEFGMTNIYLTSHYNGVNNYNTNFPDNLIKDDTIQQKAFRFVPGIQWTFIKKKFVEFHCGFSADYFYYGKMYWKDNLKDNIPGDYDRWVGTTPGGFAVGTGAFAGFNIYPCKHISFGAEFSSTFLYYKIGGVQEGERIFHFSSAPATIREWRISDNVAKGTQFSKVMSSVNITLHF